MIKICADMKKGGSSFIILMKEYETSDYFVLFMLLLV